MRSRSSAIACMSASPKNSSELSTAVASSHPRRDPTPASGVFSARWWLLRDMNAFAPRRSTEPQISEAITLGWRIATLYSLRASELPSAPPDNLLPMRRSLPAAERLVLELRPADGDAGRLGIGLEPAALEELVELAWHAPDSDAAEAAFRARIRAWHIDLQTRLWAEHEPTGKAYELGSFF